MTRKLWLVVIVCMAGAVTVPSLGAGEEAGQAGNVGLSVSPGGLLIQDVEPGQLYDMADRSNILLKVSNHEREPRTYRLSTHLPSSVGNRKWLDGYVEIPDPSWFRFEQDEVTVPAESDSRVKMFLQVPEGEQYYNQHWVVSVGIRGASRPGETVALAAYPRYQIETQPKADIESAPIGSLGLEPSIILFEDIPLDESQEASVTVYNGDAIGHQYAISIKKIAINRAREQIVPSPGYTWIPDLTWISVQRKQVDINGTESRAVNVQVKVPHAPQHYSKRWEALLWIESEEGLPRFIRIKIQTVEAASTP